jgi:hypothetical protein
VSYLRKATKAILGLGKEEEVDIDHIFLLSLLIVALFFGALVGLLTIASFII